MKFLKPYLYLQYVLLVLWIFVAGPLLFWMFFLASILLAEGAKNDTEVSYAMLIALSWFLLSWGIPIIVSIFSLKATKKLLNQCTLAIVDKIFLPTYIVMYLLISFGMKFVPITYLLSPIFK
jgi:hypothetical protein